MFIVTNREIHPNAKNFAQLGDRPSSKGPNELRLVRADRAGSSWKVQVLPDTISQAMKNEVGIIDPGDVFASRYVAKKILRALETEKRNFLFFVHGYNNDIKDVLDRAYRFEQLYNVEVLAFS